MYLPGQMPVISTPQLQTLADLWLSKRKGDALPCRSDFSDDDLRPWFGNMLVVELVEGPHRFRFRLMGTSLVNAASRELTGKFFDEADISGYDPDVLQDYDEVVRSRAPLCKTRHYRPVPGAFMEHWRIYERLLLPLASDGKTIDRILGCSYPLAEKQHLSPVDD
ncbi:MAG: PAS domain-containing protein [Dongiaceae bacterium]